MAQRAAAQGNMWNQLVLSMALHGSLCNMDVIKNKKGIQTIHLSIFHEGIWMACSIWCLYYMGIWFIERVSDDLPAHLLGLEMRSLRLYFGRIHGHRQMLEWWSRYRKPWKSSILCHWSYVDGTDRKIYYTCILCSLMWENAYNVKQKRVWKITTVLG